MSKLNQERLQQTIDTILKYSKVTKQRKFTETVELQIGLKNYDPSRDKRFAGSVVLPNPTKKSTTVLVIADQKHIYECQEKGLEFMDVEGLKKFNKVRISRIFFFCFLCFLGGPIISFGSIIRVISLFHRIFL